MKAFFIATVVAAGLYCGGAYAAPKEGGRINLIVQPEPPGLMVGIYQNAPTKLVAGQIYEGLLRYDEHLKPMPSLAKSWEISPDGLTYTFHLQTGVTWHDGQPFSAADVLFSVNDFLMKTLPRHRNIMQHVKSVTAPDDHTVIFEMKHPFDPFIRALGYGSMPMIPKHLYEGTNYNTNPNNEKPIGTGPFKFVEWKRGSFIKLAKNPSYYQKGRPHLDEIFYYIIPDGAARADAFETGKVDVLPGGSVENFDVPRLSKLKGACITAKGWEYNAPLSWLWFNVRRPPMNDVRFRQAVMYAMDRKFALDALWNGLGKVATGPIPSNVPFHKVVDPQYPYDPGRARELLKEMGYKGEPIKLMPLPYGETWQRWAEAIRQNLGEVGIPVELEAVDVPGWTQRNGDWDFDMTFTFFFQDGDPAIGGDRAYKTSQISKGTAFNNVGGYSNPEVDRLFEEAALAYPASARQKIYDKLQVILQKDVPVGWLLELTFPTIYKCEFKNLVTSANGVSDSLGDTYIDE